jgi:hypothetical protein
VVERAGLVKPLEDAPERRDAAAAELLTADDDAFGPGTAALIAGVYVTSISPSSFTPPTLSHSSTSNGLSMAKHPRCKRERPPIRPPRFDRRGLTCRRICTVR